MLVWPVESNSQVVCALHPVADDAKTVGIPKTGVESHGARIKLAARIKSAIGRQRWWVTKEWGGVEKIAKHQSVRYVKSGINGSVCMHGHCITPR